MTKLLMVSALLSIAGSAQAVPAAPTVLAKTVSSGAYVPAGVCDGQEITIYSDGKVIKTQCGNKATLQLTLGKEKTTLLTDMAKNAGQNGGKLEPIDPNSPQLLDGGATSISLVSPKGTVLIGGVQNGQQVALVWGDRMMHSEETALRFIKAINQIVNAPFGN